MEVPRNNCLFFSFFSIVKDFMISYYEPAFGVAALAEPLKLCPQGPDIATPLEVEANLASAHGDDLH